MEITPEQREKAMQIERNAPSPLWLAQACALLTSPVKAERECGKQLVREWKKGNGK
jgi:hypothetical protein